jgi:hypothetical protein
VYEEARSPVMGLGHASPHLLLFLQWAVWQWLGRLGDAPAAPAPTPARGLWGGRWVARRGGRNFRPVASAPSLVIDRVGGRFWTRGH